MKIENLPSDVLDAVFSKYPEGLVDHISNFSMGNGQSFHALSFDYDDISYLIKVNLKIDNLSILDKEDNIDEVLEDIDTKVMEKELQADAEEEEAADYKD